MSNAQAIWKLRVATPNLEQTHVGSEGNELADRMAMLGVQHKEKNCDRIRKK